ncbi:hypothetical protein PR048_024896 [Dryococelus australis]|uniref:Uncharacterized protein n=1 Tax=Dryococelus australis TaxID=614101 RepID=A0ABQ9GPX9_9NEOP|nr:hypothetical protein PR048_024896 [Dryococelus australis]
MVSQKRKKIRRARYTDTTRKCQLRQVQKKYSQKKTLYHAGKLFKYQENNLCTEMTLLIISRHILKFTRQLSLNTTFTQQHDRTSYDPEIAYESDHIVTIGDMKHKCQWCNVLKGKGETSGMCFSS